MRFAASTAAELAFGYLRQCQFVSLTTYRRTGAPVSTPMWIAADGDQLLCWTPAASGKVKRLGHTPAVALRRCSRRGSVEPGTPVITGTATVESSPDAVRTALQAIRRTYGRQVDVVLAAERMLRRPTERVAIRITLDPLG